MTSGSDQLSTPGEILIFTFSFDLPLLLQIIDYSISSIGVLFLFFNLFHC